MGKYIKGLYKKAGIKPPIGKGEHTIAFHKLAIRIMTNNKLKKGKLNKNIAYATAMKILGRNKAVKT